MEGDRKYRHPGYMDSGATHNGDNGHKPAAKPPLDGPRLPRMVQTVTAARCWNCSTTLAADSYFSGACPKCRVALHCCRQCSYFEPSTRYQCVKPIAVRVAHKDEHNDCALFKPAVTVARDSGAFPNESAPQTTKPAASAPAPKNAADARAAFDNLFKK